MSDRDEYAPRTDEVRADYAQKQMLSPYYEGGRKEIEQGEAEFDRWLARERAEAAAREAEFQAGCVIGDGADLFLRRADRIRSEAGIGGGDGRG